MKNLGTSSDSLDIGALNSIQSSHSIWFWIAVLEFVIIVIILFYHRRSNIKKLPLVELKKEKAKEYMKTEVDMNDVLSSITKSRDLYKELSRKYHPDRFVNTPLEVEATIIFQEITKNKRNYSELLILKERAEKEL